MSGATAAIGQLHRIYADCGNSYPAQALSIVLMRTSLRYRCRPRYMSGSDRAALPHTRVSLLGARQR